MNDRFIFSFDISIIALIIIFIIIYTHPVAHMHTSISYIDCTIADHHPIVAYI